MQNVAPNLWIKQYPLNMLGMHHDRIVTLIRLASGALIIHSTAPFSAADVAEIRALGRPGWLIEAMLLHDTFARQGRAAFPTIPYLAPNGFAESAHVDSLPLLPAPPEWGDEVRVHVVDGMPYPKEHVFLHVPSRTLIVADLVFNFAPSSGWKSFARRWLMGVKEHPDSARLFPKLIRNRPAYNASMREILEWDFDRIIVGHNERVETDGKQRLIQALARKGMLPP